MVGEMAVKLSYAAPQAKLALRGLGGAAGVLGLATDVAKHVVWYLAHQIDGRPRDRA